MKRIDFSYVILARPLIVSRQHDSRAKGRISGKFFDARGLKGGSSNERTACTAIWLDVAKGLIKIEGTQAGHILSTERSNMLVGYDMDDAPKTESAPKRSKARGGNVETSPA